MPELLNDYLPLVIFITDGATAAADCQLENGAAAAERIHHKVSRVAEQVDEALHNHAR